ncbi:conserved hypothetical protein [Mesorhizobium prunaredense]|uniref:Uncharacterized protein n=1 Tax=Mesorhizobium prunaredense TaxID=1631249 RepID=A0A1R3V7G3_9HYPH|nr:conserved hypothetical protein [Mesorhizobium prunaredense]
MGIALKFAEIRSGLVAHRLSQAPLLAVTPMGCHWNLHRLGASGRTNGSANPFRRFCSMASN